MSFNVVDAIFLVLTIAAGLRGFQRGFVKQLIGGIGLASSMAAALIFEPMITSQLSTVWGDYNWIAPLVFILLFAAGLILSLWLSQVLSKVIRAFAWKKADHLLGLLIGLLEGVILCCVILVMTGLIAGDNTPELLKNSILVPFLLQLMPFLAPSLRNALQG